jgi:hypothetical protein
VAPPEAPTCLVFARRITQQGTVEGWAVIACGLVSGGPP